jgi:predicted GH43/DUF377 family glycosyl hydrolase
VDIIGRFYPRLKTEAYAQPEDPWNTRWDRLVEIASRTNDLRPVLATEYAHAMGNAVGNLQDYWSEIYANPRMLGGFIWEWCDQGLHKQSPEGTTFTAMGGDFGDVPNHGGFCIKGLVSAERVPFPKYWEVKKVYQPVAIAPVNLHPGEVSVRLINRQAFASLGDLEVRWSVTADGVEIQSGTLPPVAGAPGQTVTAKIPVTRIAPPAPGTEYWLRVSLHTRTDLPWAAAGFETAWQQMRLVTPAARSRAVSATDNGDAPLQLVAREDKVTIAGNAFSAVFSRTNGTLESLQYGGQEMLYSSSNTVAGPILQLFRAPTDNDKGFGKWLARDWREAGLTNLARRVECFDVRQTKTGEIQITTVATSSARQGGMKMRTLWTVRGNGSLEMDNAFQPVGTLPLLPRVGLVLSLATNLESLQWLGRGPWENYPDRKESADTGLWTSSVAEQYVPYVHPQENGNKEDVCQLILTDAGGGGLKITDLGEPLAFSALHFTAADLAGTKQSYELKPRAETVLSLDARQCGLGNSSCGPGVLARYSVSPSQTYRLHVLFQPVRPLAAKVPARTLVQAKSGGGDVDTNTMQKIFDEVKTPFKYGVVLQGAGPDEYVDCPSVFRQGGHWYMMYVAITNKVGYQTFLARSDDLLHWNKLGRALSFTRTNQWDAWQADGGIALADDRWNGSHELEKYDGKFWLSYIGGQKQGYETDPLSIGMAWTKSPDRAQEWQRLAENPVLGPRQPDARSFETKTLYKSQVIHDPAASLGWPFIMYYNAKYKNGFEQIGMAVSRDLKQWSRYGTNSVVVNGAEKQRGISGDPQIVKIGRVWVMFYFGAGWRPHAFDTFACSHDLVHWTKWGGSNLIEPSEPFDQTYAHKPWVLKWRGVVYHFYCAVGNQGRVIALATSRDLKDPPPN